MTKEKEIAEKVYLTQLEQEKINDLNASKENLNKIYSRIGELSTNLKAAENEALQNLINVSNSEQNLVNSLKDKYGNFSIGENFEVIINK